MTRDPFAPSRRGRAARPREFFCVLRPTDGSASVGGGGLLFEPDRARLSYTVELRGVLRIMEIAVERAPRSFRFVLFAEPQGLASGCLMGRFDTPDVTLLHDALAAGDALWMEARTDRGVFRGAVRQLVRDANGDLATTRAPHPDDDR